jgi:LPXTG-motif cell wall-anchored protein
MLFALGTFRLLGQSQPAGQLGKVSIQDKLQIPGTELKPGEYTFSVEDRLEDRAVVRITNADGSKYTFALTVPNGQLAQGGASSLILFDTTKLHKRVLRGWVCPGCATPLEFVYPKLQAAEITGSTTEPVIAVDPSYDALPANLSPDDMKVVTLWLLTPKPVTAIDKTKGVVAAKYVRQAKSTQTAQRAESAGSPLPEAPVPNTGSLRHSRLPKTASNSPTLLVSGLMLMLAGMVLRFANNRLARNSR